MNRISAALVCSMIGLTFVSLALGQASSIPQGVTTCLELTAGTSGQDEPAVLCPVNTFVDVPPGGDTRLPDNTGGERVEFCNYDSADTLSIYPRPGEKINEGAANDPLPLLINSCAECIAKRVERWWWCTYTSTSPTGAAGPTGPPGVVAATAIRAVTIACDSTTETGDGCCAGMEPAMSCAGVMFGAVSTHLLTLDSCNRGDTSTDDPFFFALCYVPAP